MEIKDLKSIWKRTIEKQSVDNHFNKAEMLSAIHKKSSLAISKIKRRIEIQLIVFSLGALFLIASPIIFNDTLHTTMTLTIVFMISYLVLLATVIAIVYKKMKDYQKYSDDLKTRITQISKMFKKTLSIGFYMDTIGLTLIGIWFFQDKIFELKFESSAITYTTLIVGALLIFFVTYQLVKKIQYAKYGKHVTMLDECLNELNATQMT